jgi:hypothetical protein
MIFSGAFSISLFRELSIPSDIPSSQPAALDIHDKTSSFDDHERSLLFPTQAFTVDREFYPFLRVGLTCNYLEWHE